MFFDKFFVYLIFSIYIKMSEKVIRITSQQGFAAEWLNAAQPTTLNLCDFVMPQGLGVIDMSKSYIAFNSLIENSPAGAGAVPEVVNAGFFLDVDADGTQYNVPTSALVRNCHITASNVGQIESIRRQDSLSCAMFSLNHTAEEQKSDMNVLSAFNNGRGTDVFTTYGLEAVVNNVSPNGSEIDTKDVSRNITRDLKVPLKDIFGIGAVEDWDLQKWGETRIHIETNFTKLKSHQWGGLEDVTTGFNTTTFQGAIEAMADVPGSASAPNNVNPVIIEMSTTYGDPNYVFPFFVGQTVLINAAASAGGNVVDNERIIKSIRYGTDNTSTPATGRGKIFITLDAAFFTNAETGTVSLTTILMKAKVDDTTLKNTVTRAELVLFTRNDLEAKDTTSEIDYRTFSTEEDNGNNIALFNRSYMLEPECENFVVCCIPDSQILPTLNVTSYRYAIDNVEQTGNRDIEMSQTDKQGSSLQYERLIRCLDLSMSLPLRNAQLKFYNQLATTQVGLYDKPISVICETTTTTPSSKMLNLTITSGGLRQIVIYKQIPRTIKV